MPRSKCGGKRNPIDPEFMKNAVEAVTGPPEKRIHIKETCRAINVKFGTLV